MVAVEIKRRFNRPLDFLKGQGLQQALTNILSYGEDGLMAKESSAQKGEKETSLNGLRRKQSRKHIRHRSMEAFVLVAGSGIVMCDVIRKSKIF